MGCCECGRWFLGHRKNDTETKEGPDNCGMPSERAEKFYRMPSTFDSSCSTSAEAAAQGYRPVSSHRSIVSVVFDGRADDIRGNTFEVLSVLWFAQGLDPRLELLGRA